MLLASHLMPNIKPQTHGSGEVMLQVDTIKHKKIHKSSTPTHQLSTDTRKNVVQ